MNLNLIIELLRDSLMSVDSIKNAVSGHIYSSYLNNSSKFPCITLYFLAGSSPAHIDGAVLAVVQAKIWTDDTKNPNKLLYEIYEDIVSNFHQNHFENDNLKMGTKLGKSNSEHPPIIPEQYKGSDFYSLAAKISCRAIYV